MKTFREYLNESIIDTIKNKIEIYKLKKESKKDLENYKKEIYKEHREWMIDHYTNAIKYWKKSAEEYEELMIKYNDDEKEKNFFKKMMETSLSHAKEYEEKLKEYK